ncbi:ROK family protein [uncultured Paenibacillus sp.]|uniref:ROK family protein n=1 Tax=uncultured Paenibacillus sp. TaxID=227322 RepID=UPI0015A96494|nr:ROK family glucokinase [uncultured Paenibacillus sp.]
MDFAMRIGVDIGGTKVSCALVGEDKTILSKVSFETRGGRPYTDVLRDVADSVYSVLDEAGYRLDDVEAVGLGCPGILDQQKGEVIYSNNIAWENVPLVKTLQRYVPKEIYVDNDANCAALGEYLCGASKGTNSSVTVTLGTGVGGGIILGGRIHSGFNSAANAIGHMVIVSGGVPCTCGREGCWESYASITALVRMAEEMAVQFPDSLLAEVKRRSGQFNGKNIFDAARQNDATALKLLDKYYYFVSEGIIDLINVFQPQMIVIGGGISSEGDDLLKPIITNVKKGVYCKQVPLPQITIAKLNNDAGIIGAAYLKGYQATVMKLGI